jgi:hypothetical protein
LPSQCEIQSEIASEASTESRLGNIEMRRGTDAMQNIAIQRASELPQVVKSAVEQLLGRPIAADEEVSVASIPPQQVPPSGNRAELVRNLEAYLDRRAEKVGDLTDEEIDAAVDQAVQQARHSRS